MVFGFRDLGLLGPYGMETAFSFSFSFPFLGDGYFLFRFFLHRHPCEIFRFNNLVPKRFILAINPLNL